MVQVILHVGGTLPTQHERSVLRAEDRGYNSIMQCPICKKALKEPATGQARGCWPFCSERCKLIDLGRWLDGKYQISAAVSQEDEEGELKPED
jgi:hypothetical protein